LPESLAVGLRVKPDSEESFYLVTQHVKLPTSLWHSEKFLLRFEQPREVFPHS